MKDKHPNPVRLSAETKAIEDAMRRAIQYALLMHKRAGNTVAAWKDGSVVLVPADKLYLEIVKR